MKKFLLLCALSVLPLIVFAQGPLAPTGGPAPTMKTLTQVAPRTAIDPSATGFTTPYTITQAGSYYLTGNINISNGSSAIVISADNVTVDLNGFSLLSNSNPAAGYGVQITNNLSINSIHNIAVKNGTIAGKVTLSGSSFTGNGFNVGLAFTSQNALDIHVSDLAVSGCAGDGINLTPGGIDNTLVERVTVNEVAGYGVRAANVTKATVSLTQNTAIAASVCTDSHALTTAVSPYASQAIVADSVSNSYGSGPTGIEASTVTNCVGIGTTGIGISATVATNSQGTSTSGIGLRAERSATNCKGTSSSADGLYAGTVANTCYGQTGSSSAVGLHVTGPASLSGGANTTGGSSIAIQATAGIGCATYGGITNIPAANKFLGTP